LICALDVSICLPVLPPAAAPAAATLTLLPGRELLLSEMLEAEGTAGTVSGCVVPGWEFFAHGGGGDKMRLCMALMQKLLPDYN